jgi:hypothetical protein
LLFVPVKDPLPVGDPQPPFIVLFVATPLSDKSAPDREKAPVDGSMPPDISSTPNSGQLLVAKRLEPLCEKSNRQVPLTEPLNPRTHLPVVLSGGGVGVTVGVAVGVGVGVGVGVTVGVAVAVGVGVGVGVAVGVPDGVPVGVPGGESVGVACAKQVIFHL